MGADHSNHPSTSASRATRTWFIRHGEVEHPWVGTFIGTKDVGLSPLGHHQAEAIATYLGDSPIDAIVSSPRKRALDTAAPLAKRLGMKLDIRKGLGEMDFGQWEGMHWHEIQAKHGEAVHVWERDPANVPCPDGESCDGFMGRVVSAMEGVLEEYAGRTVAVFAHAGVNRSILGKALDMSYLRCMSFGQDYGCVNAASWETPKGPGQVALVNFVPGPRAEHQGDS